MAQGKAAAGSRQGAVGYAFEELQPYSVIVRQDEAKPLGLFWSDAGFRTRQEESLQPLMLEAPDHLRSVTLCVTQIKTANVIRIDE